MSKFKINTGKLVLVAVAATIAGASLLGTGQVYAQAQNQQSATTPLQREIAYTNTPSGAPRIEIMHVARSLGAIRPYYDAGLLTPEEGKLFVKYDSLFFGVMNSSTINPKWKDKLLTDYHKPYLFEKRQIERLNRLTGGDKILRSDVSNHINILVQSESRNPRPLLPDARNFSNSQSAARAAIDPQSVASNEPIVVNGNRKPQTQSSGSQSTANQSNQAPVINEGPGPYQRIYKDSGDPIRDRLAMNDDVFPVTREKVEKQGTEGLKILQTIYDDWDPRKDPSYLNGLKTKEDVNEYKTAMEEVQSAINLYKSILNKSQPQSAESQPTAKQQNQVSVNQANTVTKFIPAASESWLKQLDGNWSSKEWKYGYQLKNGVGIATATNSPNFRVGQKIIQLTAKSATSFVGQQVYTDGKFYNVKVTLQPDGRLYFEGEKNAKWYMER